MNTEKGSKINQLLQAQPKGVVFLAFWLYSQITGPMIKVLQSRTAEFTEVETRLFFKNQNFVITTRQDTSEKRAI